MRVLILANGDSPSPEFARRLAAESDLVVATDGAAHRAAGAGLTPHLVTGDFDSAQPEIVRLEFPNAELLATPDQNLTDLEKAVQVVLSRGATEITVLGATGGRLDHTVASLLLVLRYPQPGGVTVRYEAGALWGLDGTVSAVEFAWRTAPGDIISLISPDGRARIRLRGTRWPLDDELLPLGTRGVSNEALAEEVCVRVEGGRVVVCHESIA